jgi:hypothetical protein
MIPIFDTAMLKKRTLQDTLAQKYEKERFKQFTRSYFYDSEIVSVGRDPFKDLKDAVRNNIATYIPFSPEVMKSTLKKDNLGMADIAVFVEKIKKELSGIAYEADETWDDYSFLYNDSADRFHHHPIDILYMLPGDEDSTEIYLVGIIKRPLQASGGKLTYAVEVYTGRPYLTVAVTEGFGGYRLAEQMHLPPVRVLAKATPPTTLHFTTPKIIEIASQSILNIPLIMFGPPHKAKLYSDVILKTGEVMKYLTEEELFEIPEIKEAAGFEDE